MKKTDFLNRFTDTEKENILVASATNALLKLVLFELQNAEEIDETSQKVINRVNALETAGLIETGRAAIILGSSDIIPHVHHLVLISGTTFQCNSTCGKTIEFSAFGVGEPSVDENGNPPLNPEQWMGACE